MNKRERHIILTRAYGDKKKLSAYGRAVFSSRSFVTLRDSTKLHAHSPRKISHRGRPSLLSAAARSPLMHDRNPDPETASPIIPAAPKHPGRPAKSNRNPFLDFSDPTRPEKYDFIHLLEELRSAHPYHEPYLLVTVDASEFFSAYPMEQEVVQAAYLQFYRMTDYIGLEYPRGQLDEYVFASCLPERLLSNAYLSILTLIPVSSGQDILNIPTQVSVKYPTSGEPVKYYDLPEFPARSRTRSLDSGFFDFCFLEMTYSPATDIRTGSSCFDEVLPYLIMPGGIAGITQANPALLHNASLFRSFFELILRRICEHLSGRRVFPPVSLRLCPDYFASKNRSSTFEMLSYAADLLQKLSVPLCSLFFEISSSVVSAAGDILKRGFHTVIYDYPPLGATLSPLALDRAGVSAVKFDAARITPDSSAARMLLTYEQFGIIPVVEGISGAEQLESWRAAGANIFQNRLFPKSEQEYLSRYQGDHT